VKKHKQRREGAVLVEGVIVAAAMVCLFGCVLIVHLYGSLQLQRLDEAREQAWREAMQGCGGDEPVLQDMARELLSGEFPFPDGILPSARSASRSFSVRGVFSATGQKEIRFLCGPQPSGDRPLTDMAGWVLGLFT
jgi:hypothetical protein